MNRVETLKAVTPALLAWYRTHCRTLPWRSDPTPYHVWISEIMLQQTRVAAVLDYYARFTAALPDVAALADEDEDLLLKLWQGLGYYNRARNLQKAARQIMTVHGGAFPSTYEDLLALPGVGDYTAGAIGSIAFGLPVPCVDGNVLRVLMRFWGDDSDVTLPRTKQDVQEALLAAIPKDAPGTFNQALMELGALVCVPNGAPLCESCPLAPNCAALREDLTDSLPVKPVKKPRRIESRRVWLLFRGDRVALRRRPAKGLLANLWEFPNELIDEPKYSWKTLSETEGPAGKHVFSHIEWHMESVLAEAAENSLPEGCVWATAEELQTVYAVPGAFDAFKPAVKNRLSI